MKAYEILPAGMTGSAMDDGGAKKPKPHEILPGAGVAAQGLGGKHGGCGCGGSCVGGDGGLSKEPMWQTPPQFASAALFGASKLGDVDLGGISRLGPGGSGYGARPCWFIESRIIGLRTEIADRRRRFGPRIDEVSNAWLIARQACNSAEGADVCHWIGEVLTNSGRGGINWNLDLGRYNQLNRMYLECQAGQGNAATRQVYRLLVCQVLRETAVRLETAAVQAQPPEGRVDYQYDIWPLEQEALALEAQLRVCEQVNTSPSKPEPFASCSLIGSGGCSQGRKRCSYGDCDDGGSGCDRNISCGPGNWDPACPASSNCGRY